MFLSSKVGWSGIVFILLTTGISGPRPTPLAADANSRKGMPTVEQGNDLKKMQQALTDQGQYRGKIDGAFGLRTRASIRAYQKAENLPITGQVDAQTATGLGVRPESAWGNSQNAERQVAHRDKPSAGTKRTESRAGKKRRKEVFSRRSATEDNRDKRATE